MTSFDYIIIGAGSAGCLLADRLSACGKYQVAVLEAGRRDDSLTIKIPWGVALLLPGKRFNWRFETTPQPQMGNRRMYCPRGKGLGGSSSINALVYIRGRQADFDEWASLGCEGWDYASVLPYFKRIEHNERGEDAFHGVNGPLNVCDLPEPNPLRQTFLEATDHLQIPRTPDFNGAQQEGAGVYQMTGKNGCRWSAADAFLKPAMQRPNVHVLTQAQVQALRFEGKRATGVSVATPEGIKELRAGREVILSAGAIQSPQLLMLSGVGAASELQAQGIQPVHDLPGVGENLQDHLDIGIVQRATSRQPVGLGWDLPWRLSRALYRWIRFRKGFIANSVSEAGAFLRTDPALALPDIQYQFVPLMTADHGRRHIMGWGYTLHAAQTRAFSKGRIRLADRDPRTAPLIDPNYLSDPRDLDMLVRAVKLGRRMLATPAFAGQRGAEVHPGASINDDEAIADDVRQRAETLYHVCGTCKMGVDDMAVVSPQLKVHGMEGLRVVDASVMPNVISGNTNAPTYMIAEKAAEHILHDARSQ